MGTRSKRLDRRTGGQARFPTALGLAMVRRGVSAAELAALCSVDASLVSRWLDGSRRPSVGTLERIAVVLGVRPWALWKGVVDEA